MRDLDSHLDPRIAIAKFRHRGRFFAVFSTRYMLFGMERNVAIDYRDPYRADR